VFAVARTASVVRPSVAVIVSALRGAARSMSQRVAPPEPPDGHETSGSAEPL
jgi:hypothetical protein